MPRPAACSDALVFFLCVKARTFLYPFPTVNLSVTVCVRTYIPVTEKLSFWITASQFFKQLYEACLLCFRPVVYRLAI